MKNSDHNTFRFLGLFLVLLFSTLFCASMVQARDVSFNWAANSEPVDGYRLYYKTGSTGGSPYNGTAAVEGNSPVNTGNVTSFTLHGLSDSETYYFVLTAVAGNLESDYSIELKLDPIESPSLQAVINLTKADGSLTVDFDATNSIGAITKYSWNFGDGTIEQNNATPSHTFLAGGTYNVVLTVEDANNATASTQQKITLNQGSAENKAPTASLVVTSAVIGDAPLSVSFDAAGSSDPENSTLTYFWNFGDGATATGAENQTHLYTVPGTYTTTVIVTDDQGASTSTTSQPIIVNEGEGNTMVPTARIAASKTSALAPVNVTFNGAASIPSQRNGTIIEYEWNFGDGTSRTGKMVQHTFIEPGSYTVELTVTDNSGKKAKTTTTLTALSEGAQDVLPTLIQVYKLLLLDE